MTPPTANDAFADEVEDRLEKLFGEEQPVEAAPADTAERAEDKSPVDAEPEPPDDTGSKPPGDILAETDIEFTELSDGSDESPLRELKAIVLSIDWEITDEVMLRFVQQVTVLKDSFKDDKVALVFLQLLKSIGDYIRVNLGKSHPNAFKILSSLFTQMDKVVHSETLTDPEKKKMLAVELDKYKELKNRLMPERSGVGAQVSDAAQDTGEPTAAGTRDVSAALEEIKQMLQSEFIALRKEIAQIKDWMANRE